MIATERHFAFTTFHHRLDTHPRTAEMPWDELAALLTRHLERRAKDGPGWCAVRYAPSTTRGKNGVRQVTALVLDYDHSLPPWAQLERYTYAAHTTYRHTPEGPRWRVILPLARAADASEWSQVWQRAQTHFGASADESCKDASRFFYLPSCPPGAARDTVSHGGEFLDPDRLPAPNEPMARPARPEHRSLLLSGDRYARRALEYELDALARTPEGQRNSQLNRAAFSLGQLVGGELLGRAEVEHALESVALNIGLTPGETERTIRSGLDTGEQEPRGIPAPARNGVVHATVAEPDAPVQPFPLGSLPPILRRYVEESARALVAPPDLVAVPLLTLAGAVIGNARQVEIKRGWKEGPNLYTAVITPPGGKKTPSGAAAKRPIYRVQDRLKREHEAAASRHREEMAEWEALSKVGRAGQKPPEVPKFEHVVTTDATTEAIASMLQGCKGLVLERDELSGWTRSMDQYRGGKGADRQHFLSMWSRGALKVDRKGAPPIFVPHPCLSVTGGIQPDMLLELIDSSGREDGFIDRILLSYPDEMPDCWTEDEVSLDTLMAVEDLFETLYSLPYEPGSDVGTVRLFPDARELWRTWYEANAAEQQAVDFPLHLRGAWAKMPSQLLRIALILHVVHYPDALMLPAHVMEEAIAVIGYFKSHARRVYGCLQSGRRDMGTKILEAAHERGGRVSMRELLVDVFQRHQKSDHIRAELARLEATGRLRYEKQTDTGGRPREEWVLGD